jgi:hypothetical protein
MIESFIATHGLSLALTGLWLLSEYLGETKLVKSNGVLSFIFKFLGSASRSIKRIKK